MAVFCPEEELLPHIVDHYATVKPDQIYAEYPRSPTSYDKGFFPITYRSFANVVNGIAWWLTETFGRGNGETLAYIGPNDLRYPAFVLGAVKAGYCMFLPSPRNSIAAQGHLLKTVACSKILTPNPRPPFVTSILDSVPLSSYDIPSVDDLLATEYPHFEYTKSYPGDMDDKLVILHTSGSTGIPKPITWRLSTACAHIRMFRMDAPRGFENQHKWSTGKRQFMPLPPFHAAGMASLTFINIPADVTCIMPTSAGLPTASALVEALKHTPMDMAALVPSMVQELAQESELLLDYCAQHLDYCIYMGGDLPQAIGDKVAAKLKLYNRYGSTEAGFLTPIHSLNDQDLLEDWRYTQFHPELGLEFRKTTDTEHELVLVRSPESEKYLMTFTIFPELKEFSTHDLFVRHPDPRKSDMWRWSARSDDVIVFLNGEKTNPISMEQHIMAANPGVTGVLVAGAQQFQASLIIEYGSKKLNSTECVAAIESIWPSVEEANQACPAHARIARTHILFTTPDKPFPRSGKGTIQRAAALALYSSELETLYAHADDLALRSEGRPARPGRACDIQQISEFIVQTLSSIAGWSPSQIASSENFFYLGLDSLHTIAAARCLRHGLNLPSFSPNIIYLHPSLSSLAQATMKLMQDVEISDQAVKAAQLQEREEVLAEFSAKIDGPRINAVEELPTSHTVLLSGSTGTLCTYILDALLKDTSIAHIHCLNRRPDSLEIQRQKSALYHLNSSLLSSRVTFWHADLSLSNLGLAPQAFELLQESTTTIIHGAWNVNFNLSLPSFKPDLLNLVNLINFTATASKTPNLFFLSSVSSVMGYETNSHLTPETIISTNTPAPNGYANSKHIAERLLDHAAQTRGIRTSLARVGQVAGAVRNPGLWNKAEYFPSLVRSSLQVGAIPSSIGSALDRIDWVPIDLLAEVLTGLALRESQPGCVNVYHPLNLHTTTWSSIIAVVADELSRISGGKTFETVSLLEWVQRVRRDIETAGESQKAVGESDLQALLDRNPAAKLIGFFEGLASMQPDNVLDTHVTAEVSEKLRAVEGIKEEWVRKWVREWM